MSLDIRLPMGYLFVLLGALLFFYGAFAEGTASGVADTFHADLWWGAVLSLFGGIMLYLAKRAPRPNSP